MESHTIENAMNRGELTEEEAYFILRFAGRHGYNKAIKRLEFRSPLSRLRRWFVWFGGWEMPEMMQWDKGEPAFKMRRSWGDGAITSPTPLSLFGHRITFFNGWVDIRLGCQYFVFNWRKHYAYISKDATPPCEDKPNSGRWIFRKAIRAGRSRL